MDECRTFCDSLTFIGNLCIKGILNVKAKKFLKISFLHHNLILINIKDTIERVAYSSLVLVENKNSSFKSPFVNLGVGSRG